MATSVIFEEQVEIPFSLHTLADFRRWALSADFPQRGRIDFIRGQIEVDMSPEDLFCHGTLKGDIFAVLHQLTRQKDLGHLFVDGTLVSCPDADWSAEPDVVMVLHETLSTGRVKLVPKASLEDYRFVEVEGPPDLIVEIVSDSSVTKDTKRLPAAYFAAGVGEFWLADARRKKMFFQIYQPGEDAYHPVTPDKDGFQASAVFGCGFRLERTRDPRGHWRYDLYTSG